MLFIINIVYGQEFSSALPKQRIHLKGQMDGNEFEFTPKAYGACLYATDLEIQFEEIQVGIAMYDNIEINHINDRGLLKVGLFKINKKPIDDSEVDINFNFAHACGARDIESGTFEIIRLEKERIVGRMQMNVSANDWIICEFDLILYDAIAKLPFPPKNMNGTELEYSQITDSYPAVDLKNGELIISGNFKDTKFDNILTVSHINLNKGVLEIIAPEVEELNRIEIELQASPIDEKLCIGKFLLIPMDRQGKINLKHNELFAEWEDSITKDSFGDDYPIDGTFEILAYDSTTIAGSFEFNILEKNESVGFANGMFKLPFRLVK